MLSATRPNRPNTNNENAIVVTESVESSGARRKARNVSRRMRLTARRPRGWRRPRRSRRRSEEHTSELQSPYDLVCRLLLEKKKQIRSNPESQKGVDRSLAAHP